MTCRIACLLTLFSGCAALPGGDDEPAEALAAPSLFKGEWLTPAAVPAVRATAATLGTAVVINVTLASDPTSHVALIRGTLDPDGRHLLSDCTVDGQPRKNYAFVAANSQRMFVGLFAPGTIKYEMSWAFNPVMEAAAYGIR